MKLYGARNSGEGAREAHALTSVRHGNWQIARVRMFLEPALCNVAFFLLAPPTSTSEDYVTQRLATQLHALCGVGDAVRRVGGASVPA